MQTKFVKEAFSLVELSVVAIIAGILIVAIVSGKGIIAQSSLVSAQALTKSSAIYSIPGLELWLEPTLSESITGATSGYNLSNNDSISAWDDISGNKISVTQVTETNRPKYLLLGINNLPSLSFNGLDNYLFSTSKTPIQAGDDDFTFIAVWKRLDPSGSEHGVIFEQNNNGTAVSGERASINS